MDVVFIWSQYMKHREGSFAAEMNFVYLIWVSSSADLLS